MPGEGALLSGDVGSRVTAESGEVTGDAGVRGEKRAGRAARDPRTSTLVTVGKERCDGQKRGSVKYRLGRSGRSKWKRLPGSQADETGWTSVCSLQTPRPREPPGRERAASAPVGPEGPAPPSPCS